MNVKQTLTSIICIYIYIYTRHGEDFDIILHWITSIIIVFFDPVKHSDFKNTRNGEHLLGELFLPKCTQIL